MFCTHCGQQLPNDASFCWKCGTRVQGVSTSHPQTPAPKKPAGHWEYREFTHRFNPITSALEFDPMIYFHNQVEIEVKYTWLPELKRSGWEPDESIEINDLMDTKRLHFTVETESAGLFRKKEKYITADAATARFKRWVE